MPDRDEGIARGIERIQRRNQLAGSGRDVMLPEDRQPSEAITPDPRAEAERLLSDYETGGLSGCENSHDVPARSDPWTGFIPQARRLYSAAPRLLRALLEALTAKDEELRSLREALDAALAVGDDLAKERDEARSDAAAAHKELIFYHDTSTAHQARAEKAEAELRSLREASAGLQGLREHLDEMIALYEKLGHPPAELVRWRNALPSPPGAPAATSPSEEETQEKTSV